jgi:hypothetical protein
VKTKLLLASVLTTLTLGANPVFAGTPVLNDRQAQQEKRIEQGIRSGELTRTETARLAKGQVELQRMENRAKRDGEVTHKERARLHNKANVESRKIHRQKHDTNRR